MFWCLTDSLGCIDSWGGGWDVNNQLLRSMFLSEGLVVSFVRWGASFVGFRSDMPTVADNGTSVLHLPLGGRVVDGVICFKW